MTSINSLRAKSPFYWLRPIFLLAMLAVAARTNAAGQTSDSATVDLVVSGTGYISPNLFGQILKTGKVYSLTAIPEVGEVFSNWSGDINSSQNPLVFTLQSNIVVYANFIPDPFSTWEGTYSGLFAETNGVTEQTAGMLRTLTVQQQGPSRNATYTATLLINGENYSFTGAFDLAGQSSNRIQRSASQGGPLILQMSSVTFTNIVVRGRIAEPGGVILTNSLVAYEPGLTGTVSGAANRVPWVANLTARKADYFNGAYTMLIPPDTNNEPPTLSPGGYGYALIGGAGLTTTVTGELADGTIFSQSAAASHYGWLPLFVNLYADKGLLTGWVYLRSNVQDSSAAANTLTWIHPARASGLYQNGFTNVLSASQIQVSAWGFSPQGPILEMTNLWIPETINGTNLPIPVSTATPGEVLGASVHGTINPRNGELTVTVASGGNKVTGHGAIVLNATNGAGYILTKTNSEAFILSQ
jgi:hypothetical protein